MQKRLLNILLLLLPLMAVAQVRFAGACYDVPNPSGVDHVVLFASLSGADSYIEYTGSDASFRWCDFAGNVVQQGSGAETLYPEDAHGYVLYSSDDTVTIYVIDYSQYRVVAESLSAEMDCKESRLTFAGSIPNLVYSTPSGAKRTLAREVNVTYTTLAWDGETWQDSVATETLPLSATMVTEAPYRNTTFTLSFDQYSVELGLAPDSMVSEEYEAVAVVCRPASVTTVRGTSIENEPSRPIMESQLSGSSPMEINFLSNANKPVAEFFRWEIYKGTTLIASRTDEDQRYTFTTNGAYQVYLWVYNNHCTTDSTVFDLFVSESQLLVPNVFSPNGDGVNDEFRVVYRSLAEFHCWVYNRWGKLVYQWDDPAKGWDGMIGGRPAAAGAYYYVIRARGTDAAADVKYHKVTKRRPADQGVYQMSGDINLVR